LFQEKLDALHFFPFPVEITYTNIFFWAVFFLGKFQPEQKFKTHCQFSLFPQFRPAPSPDAASKPFKQPPLHITPALHPAHVPLAYQCHQVGRQMESPPCQLALNKNGSLGEFRLPGDVGFHGNRVLNNCDSLGSFC